jgi:NAD(P)-dependent dehydrogenase (short-subunit alcohol dehydrogenase family)
VEIAERPRPSAVDAVWQELSLPNGPPEVRRIGESRSIRILDCGPCEAAAPPLARRPDGVYLITGGLGALGLQAARVLAQRGAIRIVLASRRGLPPREAWTDLIDNPHSDPSRAAAVQTIRDLERQGVAVETMVVDAADSEQMRSAVSSIRRRCGALHGVVHAAGVLRDGLLRNATKRQIEEVFRPKELAARALIEAAAGSDLDFVVLFSSLAGVEGNVGQGIYSAANGALDGLAQEFDRADGARVMSLAWGPWSQIGMAAGVAAERRMAELGWRTISPALGRTLFAHALDHPRPQWTICRRIEEPTAPPSPALLPVASKSAPAAPRNSSGLDVRTVVRRVVADVLRLPVDQLEDHLSFSELGVDSLASSFRSADDRTIGDAADRSIRRLSRGRLGSHGADMLAGCCDRWVFLSISPGGFAGAVLATAPGRPQRHWADAGGPLADRSKNRPTFGRGLRRRAALGRFSRGRRAIRSLVFPHLAGRSMPDGSAPEDLSGSRI